MMTCVFAVRFSVVLLVLGLCFFERPRVVHSFLTAPNAFAAKTTLAKSPSRTLGQLSLFNVEEFSSAGDEEDGAESEPSFTNFTMQQHGENGVYLLIDFDSEASSSGEGQVEEIEGQNILQKFLSKLSSLHKSAVADGNFTTTTFVANENAAVDNSEEISELIEHWKQGASLPQRMTLGKRKRLEKEISLLKQLSTADHQVKEEFARIWINERGEKAASALSSIGAMIRTGAPVFWNQAEIALLAMIEKEGVQFVAPLQLLAALYGVQGRFQEAKAINEIVLQQKPWHFGALVGIYGNCLALSNTYYRDLVKWDAAQLPPLSELQNRLAWIETMVGRAEKMLERNEFAFSYVQDEGRDGILAPMEDAWQ